ncbi:helix-turn-helix transcriptional regulator [Streptomyces guryensis]|uniref:Helix-turn-helix domain-containing protein n=1 Tax=Streptomyces guryensis TaxID=2886947 RepID=A0A9Q3ZC66_9ACTN|nr:helix-turn-helix domain-containing protein [Streptomyces guryensis]MCD9879327.1 helix-turn-helix domain-containing protein [Streptomyces guryensis]
MVTAHRSPRRREVLDVLRTAAVPLGVAEAAERIGVHPNTVRFHLEALAGEGLVERRVLEPSGPGRPRTVYAPRPGMERGGTRSYRLLAQMLLGRIAATGPDARATAMEAGRAWGRSLVEPPPPSRRPGPEESAARLVELLDGLGFAPDPEGGSVPSRIRLRHCPFLELAEEYGQLVCPLHLALMQGALAELRAPLTATGLEPFAEPDACLAHLAPAPHQTAERHP